MTTYKLSTLDGRRGVSETLNTVNVDEKSSEIHIVGPGREKN